MKNKKVFGLLTCLLIFAALALGSYDEYGSFNPSGSGTSGDASVSSNTSQDDASDKTEKDNDTLTNNESKYENCIFTSLCEYTFPIPNTWNILLTDVDGFFATKTDSASLLVIARSDSSATVNYDTLLAKDNEGWVTKELGSLYTDAKISDPSPFESESIKGLNYQISYSNGAKKDYALVFPSEEENKWIFVMFSCSSKAGNTLEEEYLNIINSIHKSTADDEVTVSKDFSIGTISFSIPIDWIVDTEEAELFMAGKTYFNETVLLSIATIAENSDRVNYETLKAKYEKGVLTSQVESIFEEVKEISSEPYDSKTVRGFMFHVSFEENNISGKADIFYLPSEKDSKWYYFIWTHIGDTNNLSDDMYIDVLNSISIAKKEATDDGVIPSMPGASLSKAIERLNSRGYEIVYEEDNNDGTRTLYITSSLSGIIVNILYVTDTLEIMTARITSDLQSTNDDQKAIIKVMSELLCPAEDAEMVSDWVYSNVGSNAQVVINGFTYVLEVGPLNNILYYAGEFEWEDWYLEHNPY